MQTAITSLLRPELLHVHPKDLLASLSVLRFYLYLITTCRAFPPHHPLIPVDYQLTGQPVLIGGTMGTNSYILTGTQKGMQETFGSTCHGAGRARSRNNSRNKLSYQEVCIDFQ